MLLQPRKAAATCLSREELDRMYQDNQGKKSQAEAKRVAYAKHSARGAQEDMSQEVNGA